jgi:hypothetical protein
VLFKFGYSILKKFYGNYKSTTSAKKDNSLLAVDFMLLFLILKLIYQHLNQIKLS